MLLVYFLAGTVRAIANDRHVAPAASHADGR